MSEQNCGFFVNDNSHQFYKNCSGFSHSKGTVMQCTFLESKNIGIFRDINFLMPDYELLQIKRVKLLKFFVGKTLCKCSVTIFCSHFEEVATIMKCDCVLPFVMF